MVLQWSERRLHVHASSSPHDPDSWTTVGSFPAQRGHHQRSCCSLSPSRVVAADNRADLTVFRLDAPPGSEAGAAADGGLGPGGWAGVFEADDDRESSRKRNRGARPADVVSSKPRRLEQSGRLLTRFEPCACVLCCVFARA